MSLLLCYVYGAVALTVDDKFYALAHSRDAKNGGEMTGFFSIPSPVISH